MAIKIDDYRVKVEKGDSLWEIAAKFLDGGKNYPRIKTLNGLTSNLIYPGQVLKIKSDGSTPSKTTSSSNMATVKGPFLQADVDNTLFATWTWKYHDNKDKPVKEYTTEWTYYTKDKIWMYTGDKSTNYLYSTCSIPANATKVRFRVLPVAEPKTETKNGKEVTTTPWTADWTDASKHEFVVGDNVPPDAPDAPKITIDGYKLTMTLEGIDPDYDATHIEFKVLQDDTTIFKANAISKPLKITYPFEGARGSVSAVIDVAAGHDYTVYCRAIRDNLKSDWSKPSETKGTKPSTPKSIADPKALSSKDVYLKWDSVLNATSYEIEYATEERYFDAIGPDAQQVKKLSVEKDKNGVLNSYANILGLDSGKKYFFRVRAKNSDGESSWTNIVSVVIGKKPAAPTTWSSTTTVISGEPLTLYWVHCAEDNSNQTLAELTLTIKGETRRYGELAPGEYAIDSSGGINLIHEFTEEDEAGKTNSCTVDTTKFTEGVKIQWSVRTAGITKDYGDMSIERTVDVYAPPTLKLDLFKVVTDTSGEETTTSNVSIDVVESFPFYLSALAGPATQTPTGYHVSILSDTTYETVDTMGNSKTIRAGEAVYSKYFDVSDSLLVEFSAGNLDLQNGMSYTANVVVSMDSGLTSENSYPFSVSWVESTYAPNVEIALNTDLYTASLRPYCEEQALHYYKVEKNYRTYTLTTEELEEIYGEEVENATTTTGEKVYYGMTSDGVEVYYSTVAESSIVDNVTLSIYRREFDGTFTEIATGLENSKSVYVTDPHPSLDYARYRIVATAKDTGSVSYYDAPGYYVGANSIIIQWDEKWSSFDTFGNDDPLVEPSWSGSILKLAYNIDVSESNSPDKVFVEYAGRKHPVGYYGTQLGETASWTTTIPKSDKETLYALRRLKIWSGDVYVREPSGVGYWASITVSFNQKHRDLTIPVSFSITRVEGGM